MSDAPPCPPQQPIEGRTRLTRQRGSSLAREVEGLVATSGSQGFVARLNGRPGRLLVVAKPAAIYGPQRNKACVGYVTRLCCVRQLANSYLHTAAMLGFLLQAALKQKREEPPEQKGDTILDKLQCLAEFATSGAESVQDDGAHRLLALSIVTALLLLTLLTLLASALTGCLTALALMKVFRPPPPHPHTHPEDFGHHHRRRHRHQQHHFLDRDWNSELGRDKHGQDALHTVPTDPLSEADVENAKHEDFWDRTARGRPKTVFLVRHGESQGNVDKNIYETVPDHALHLTAKGWDEAKHVGEHIRARTGNDTVRFICSPYTRTRETLNGIALVGPLSGPLLVSEYGTRVSASTEHTSARSMPRHGEDSTRSTLWRIPG
eukprot:scaffold5540_cov390-Prasinococcus_capsulatus_cf.AAC.6